KPVTAPVRSCSLYTCSGTVLPKAGPEVNRARLTSPDQSSRVHRDRRLRAGQVNSEYRPPAGSTRYSFAAPLLVPTPSPPLHAETTARVQLVRTFPHDP